MLHVGCGSDVREGWVNVDIEDLPGVVKGNASTLPFKDDTFAYVLASHVLEHMPDAKSTIQEMVRVLAPKATLEIRVPDYRDSTAFADLEHVHFFTPYSLDYFVVPSGIVRRMRVVGRSAVGSNGHRYPKLFSAVNVEEVRGWYRLRTMFKRFKRLDRSLKSRFGRPVELRFYCVKA